MDNTDYIESYFTNELAPDQAREFEKRIESDPAFAEEVAFYLSALNISREVAQTEKKEQFKKLYQNNFSETQVPIRKISGNRPLRRLVYYISAAAIVIGIIFGAYTFTNNVSPQQLATQYEKDNLENLSVTMSSIKDSIQTGLDLYNNGKIKEALLHFETILQSDSNNFDALEYAGISDFKLKNYDEALNWFNKLETCTGYSNPAVFYQALTLIKRNQSGDVVKAKDLLQKIVQNDLDKKETAEKWLKRLK